MAEFDRWEISITTVDGVGRPMVFQSFVAEDDAQDYLSQADSAGRAGTALGDFIAKYLLTQDGAFVQSSVGLAVVNDPVSNPADTVLRGNKILVHTRAGGRGLVFTIPARKTSAYTQEVDSLKIDITAAGALKNFLTSYALVATDMFGNSVTPMSAEIVD